MSIDSGSLPTWSFLHSPLAHWQFQSLIWDSSILSSRSSSSTAWVSLQSPSSPHSVPASVFVRWSSLATFSAFTVSNSVSGYIIFPQTKQTSLGGPFFLMAEEEANCSSRVLQRTRLCRLVCRQRDCRRPAYQCCQHKRPRICWHYHHSRSNMASHCLRLQSCTPLRSLVMDSIHHHLPHCPRRIRPQRPIQQLANASRQFRGWKHSVFCCKRVRLRHGLDKLRGRLHSLSTC